MNCYQHPERSAVAYCRTCGRALCESCQRVAAGSIFCPEHSPEAPKTGPEPFSSGASANPYTTPVSPPPATAVRTSPALAFLLGLIPGVGAIYNSQYVKGLTHAVIFGLLISIMDSVQHSSSAPLFGMLIAAFYFYMPFEAYHTARKRQLGLPLDEWSSLVANNRFGSRAPLGPVLLIIVGILFLLDSMNVVRLSELGRFWPVLLIVIGGMMLYSRLASSASIHTPAATDIDIVESHHER